MLRLHPPHRPTHHSRTAARSAAGLVALLVLTGCGSDGGGAKSVDQVASLPTSAGPAKDQPGAPPGTSANTASGTSGVPAGGRPQRRLDTSAEEEKRMWDTYEACLSSKGVDIRQTGTVEGEIARTKKYAREFKECEVKMPLMVPEMDPKQNPKYADDMRDWVKCMNGKGMKVKVTSDGWTFTGESSLSNEQQRKVEQDCKMEAFGGKR
ncbi:hypothetical protein [Embleya sp. AB8]|uniref:hypothetical protein n=1 Tax=Embleya sp. AB8 TaxID=3156304 RepID=UPI003C70C5DB